jgi:predicted RNase H-like HicB family nuclease
MPKYTIVIEKGENNYSAYCLDLPGVIATGPTREEIAQRMTEAMEFHLEGLMIEGYCVPEPTTTASVVEV